MQPFEALLQEHWGPLMRYVRFCVSPAEAEDVLQETLAAAFRAFGTLQDEGRFKPWILGIARNKCADALRRRYRTREVSLSALRLAVLPEKFARTQDSLVDVTLEKLSPEDARLLLWCYYQQLPLREISVRLGIPIGTVKSRLHAARERFRALYPHKEKEVIPMKKTMPAFIPPYRITRREDAPFPVKWEEMMGWFIIPRVGEALTWAMYDDPDGHRTEVDHLKVTGRAMIHGIEGVEITVETEDAMDCNQISGATYVQRDFIAQLTDTHCRTLAETHMQNGVRQTWTFLDGSDFLDNWGFGEDNCGNETNLICKGKILREGSEIRSANRPFLLDVVGRYDVEIAGKRYDAICVMDLESYMDGMVTEQYLDKNGRTILWRRFNADDWQQEKYGRLWHDQLPESERITVNGRLFVHWYDCITDYILP